jgi:hypothetical protein
MIHLSTLVQDFINIDSRSVILDQESVTQGFKSLGWTVYTCNSDRFPVGSSQFLHKGQYLSKFIDGKGVYNKIDYPSIQTKLPDNFEMQTNQIIVFKPRIGFGFFNQTFNWYGNDEEMVLKNLGVRQVTVELPEPLVTFPIPPLVLAIQEYDFGAELIGKTCFLSEAKIEAAKYIQQLIDMGLLDS